MDRTSSASASGLCGKPDPFGASRRNCVHMLYQVAIDSVNTAIARLNHGDIFSRGRAVTKAQEAIDELILHWIIPWAPPSPAPLRSFTTTSSRHLRERSSQNIGGRVSARLSPFSPPSPKAGSKCWTDLKSISLYALPIPHEADREVAVAARRNRSESLSGRRSGHLARLDARKRLAFGSDLDLASGALLLQSGRIIRASPNPPCAAIARANTHRPSAWRSRAVSPSPPTPLPRRLRARI